MPTDTKGYVKYIDVPQPELGNNIADIERLQGALKKELEGDPIYVPPDLVPDFPARLRGWHHRVKVVLFKDSRGWRVVDLLPPERERHCYGVAVDLGTTRIVMRLIDLETHEIRNELGFDNPQGKIAPDVLARIHYAKSEAGRHGLQQLVMDGMNRQLERLCQGEDGAARTVFCETSPQSSLSIHGEDEGIGTWGDGNAKMNENTTGFSEGMCAVEMDQIKLMTVAGNSAMTHLFLGIDPAFLIREPYIPAVNSPEPLFAADLGLKMAKRGMVYLFPNIGAYFGGDLISGILYAEIHKKEAPCIMVDVGTNAEVVVGSREWLIACAGAAGPALEGGVSDMGMTAKPGVIDRVVIDPVTCQFHLHTIDEKPPIGICGSGMIDLAAQLFLSGMLDIRGKFYPPRCKERYFEVGDEENPIGALRLVDRADSGTGEAIVLTQVEMNSLTSSKAAMYSILQVIVEETAGLFFSDLSKFYVAGTFGSFIDPKSAIAIGMLPDIPLNRFEVLGNSSLEGATKLLMEPRAFDEIEVIRQGITYIELNVNQAFMNIFSGAKFYPHTDMSRFASVKRQIVPA